MKPGLSGPIFAPSVSPPLDALHLVQGAMRDSGHVGQDVAGFAPLGRFRQIWRKRFAGCRLPVGLPLPRQLRQVLLQAQDDHGHQCGISRYDTVGTLREGGNRERGDVYLSQLSSAFLSQTYTNVHFC